MNYQKNGNELQITNILKDKKKNLFFITFCFYFNFSLNAFQSNLNHFNQKNIKSPKFENVISSLNEENMIKMKIDPLTNFLNLIQKITIIVSIKKINKNNIKKLIVDKFYNEIFLKSDLDSDIFKSELNKAIS